jgi:hypothetical protein
VVPLSFGVTMAQALAGQETVAATATQMPNLPTQSQVTFYAKSSNTGTTYIGTSSAVSSSNGYPLEKGTSITFITGVSNTNQFWYIGTASDVIGYAAV